HIDDVAPILAGCIDNPAARNQVFNLGADTPHSVNELANVVAAAMGKPVHIEHLDARNEVSIAFSDHTKAESVFGKKEKVSLQAGVQKMADWVKRNGARESSSFEGIEIERKLPARWARVASLTR
ncbi:MAG: hypothetical protein WA859_18980, partial [Candidatus Sulfotelmatobacter sp.]